MRAVTAAARHLESSIIKYGLYPAPINREQHAAFMLIYVNVIKCKFAIMQIRLLNFLKSNYRPIGRARSPRIVAGAYRRKVYAFITIVRPTGVPFPAEGIFTLHVIDAHLVVKGVIIGLNTIPGVSKARHSLEQLMTSLQLGTNLPGPCQGLTKPITQIHPRGSRH